MRSTSLSFGTGMRPSWKEAGTSLWLWVLTSTAVTFYLIGYRTLAPESFSTTGRRSSRSCLTHLPLTNNQAEGRLRHWVILRKLCFGTRSQQDSRLSGGYNLCGRLFPASNGWAVNDYTLKALRNAATASDAGFKTPS